MLAKQKTNHPIGIYPAKNGYFEANGFKDGKNGVYIGRFKGIENAIKARKDSMNTDQYRAYRASIIKPKESDKVVDYCITKRGKMFYVDIKKITGKYETIESAIMARNNIILAFGIIPQQKKGKECSTFSPEILAIIAQHKIDVKNRKNKPKPKPKLMLIANDAPQLLAIPVINKEPINQVKAVVNEDAKTPEVVRQVINNFDDIIRPDGIFCINRNGKEYILVFLTKDGAQNMFIATSGENALKIQRDGCVFKCKGD